MVIETKVFWAICESCGEYWNQNTTKCPDCGAKITLVRCGFCAKPPGKCKCHDSG